MLRTITRSLAVVAVAAAPFVMSAPSAQAANGCTVSNTSTSSTVRVNIGIGNPPTADVEWSNVECSYVTDSTAVDFGCTITGRCQVLVNGVVRGQCITAGSCTASVTTGVNPGDTITLLVNGGSGYVVDRVVA